MKKRDFMILVDSACDLPHEYAEKHNLKVLSLKFYLDDKEYLNTLDFSSMSAEEFYGRLRNGEHAKTAQVNSSQFYHGFKEILEQGFDVLAILLSANMSGTYNSANIAKQELLEDYPDRNIILINLISGSLGTGLIVDEAIRLKQEGKDIFEIEDYLNDFKYHVMHIFTHDDLSHLMAGGRLGKLSYWIGTALRIKPIISADDDGRLKPRHKVFGRKKSLKILLDRIVELYDPSYSKKIFIGHCDCLEETTKFVEELESRLNTKVTLVHMIGPVIGAHGGPGTIAAFFTAKSR
ncbi:MAG: DegV family protein [Acholeplasmataceae bacterium]|jgi:DegV family protein with EDD domain